MHEKDLLINEIMVESLSYTWNIISSYNIKNIHYHLRNIPVFNFLNKIKDYYIKNLISTHMGVSKGEGGG